MKVGYARTSTVEQIAGFEAQIRDLTSAGCEEIFKEQLSSVDAQRAQFDAAMSFIRKGDMLVVTKIDRLARSIRDLCEIEARLQAKSAGLMILNPSMDTSTPAGRLTFGIFGCVAQFEREIMLERQKEGIAKGKAEGRYRGRAPTARSKSAEVLAMLAQGIGPTEIATQLKIGRKSVYRIKDDAAKGKDAPDVASWKTLNGAKVSKGV
jgi:DNA invertase Pin-like site-specific DNA recombinase